MEAVDPKQLLDRVRALPAAKPLLTSLGGVAGVHLVGGAVRDLLMGGEPGDLDLVVEGDAAKLAAELGSDFRNHERFGTSSVTVDGFAYDIVGARREAYPSPGALPRVLPASLAEDLLRRDFTVNAIAIALDGAGAGKLSAAPGALEDLDARLLRVLHEHSFVDDPTRLLRLVRYASRLGFEIEPGTRKLAADAVAGGALATLSGARIGAELRLLAAERNPVNALLGLRELGLDRAISPSFGLDDPDLAGTALALLPADGRADLLVLAVASRNLEVAELAELLDELGFDAADREVILAAAVSAGTIAQALADTATPAQVGAVLDSAGPELAAHAGALGPAVQVGEWLERLRHVRLEIDGGDLLGAGIEQGPAIGRGLRAALAAKRDGTVAGREAELAEALRTARDE